MGSYDISVFGAELLLSTGDDKFEFVNGEVRVSLDEQVQCVSMCETIHERRVAGIECSII